MSTLLERLGWNDVWPISDYSVAEPLRPKMKRRIFLVLLLNACVQFGCKKSGPEHFRDITSAPAPQANQSDIDVNKIAIEITKMDGVVKWRVWDEGVTSIESAEGFKMLMQGYHKPYRPEIKLTLGGEITTTDALVIYNALRGSGVSQFEMNGIMVCKFIDSNKDFASDLADCAAKNPLPH